MTTGGHYLAGRPRYTPILGARDTARRPPARQTGTVRPGQLRETLMSSGTPPVGSTGLPGRHTRSIGTGLRATGRGLGFGALSLAGAALLMALAAPLLLALPLLVTAVTAVRRDARARARVHGRPRPPAPARHRAAAAVPAAGVHGGAPAGRHRGVAAAAPAHPAGRAAAGLAHPVAGGSVVRRPYRRCRPSPAAWRGNLLSPAPRGAGRPRHRPRGAVAGGQRRRRVGPASAARRADPAGGGRARRARGPLAGHVPAAWLPR